MPLTSETPWEWALHDSIVSSLGTLRAYKDCVQTELYLLTIYGRRRIIGVWKPFGGVMAGAETLRKMHEATADG